MEELEKRFNIRWRDAAAIESVITHKIPVLIASDKAYQNARKFSDVENARIEGQLAIKRAISSILADHIELLQQFTENAQFKEWLTSVVFRLIDTQSFS
jgi:type I restriction enzyme R subunit